ncbi:MAG TPA: ATP-binding protein [bacterium]|nr:ATP-binding protein [bacterium]
MKQLAIVSGKGGTGKTTLTAAFAALADNAVLADCDVDAADLHLILAPEIGERHAFAGGLTATIDPEACVNCGQCRELCRFGAIDETYTVDAAACEGCGVCYDVCPAGAVTLTPEEAGEWYVSSTRFGPLVHAALNVAQENSGKLVAQVRQRAREIAEAEGRELIIIDGSPGIGCPVISSLTGVDAVLVCTEPTLSGRHDLERVLELAAHFDVPALVCVNKADLSPAMTKTIAAHSKEKGARFVGTIPYDESVVAAMIAAQALSEHEPGPARTAVEEIWRTVRQILHGEA